MTFLRVAAALALCPGTVAAGGPIEGACMRGGRDAADPALCTCIQAVADMTLSGSDQRLAASFFKDPDRAQQIRQSGRDSHAAFWDRYTSFGEAAEAFCTEVP